ncbi:hypothetical protein RISK_002974 [Rhodopirellula islandica]|uniref:Uncharacterized protein n=1 Tax=Rhodopirellula islandica TaxID=595434 RepID=A0A0J1BEP3_RHOIS|nr:hypothetical protein RISK_002974 [Rhodopirellula islandica]
MFLAVRREPLRQPSQPRFELNLEKRKLSRTNQRPSVKHDPRAFLVSAPSGPSDPARRGPEQAERCSGNPKRIVVCCWNGVALFLGPAYFNR